MFLVRVVNTWGIILILSNYLNKFGLWYQIKYVCKNFASSCFERFFKAVNSKEQKLIAKRRGGYMMDNLELIGIDYLWRVVLYSPDEVSEKAILLLKDIYTNLGPRLQSNQVEIHEDFLQDCMDRLKASFDTISVLEKVRANLVEYSLGPFLTLFNLVSECVNLKKKRF